MGRAQYLHNLCMESDMQFTRFFLAWLHPTSGNKEAFILAFFALVSFVITGRSGYSRNTCWGSLFAFGCREPWASRNLRWVSEGRKEQVETQDAPEEGGGHMWYISISWKPAITWKKGSDSEAIPDDFLSSKPVKEEVSVSCSEENKKMTQRECNIKYQKRCASGMEHYLVTPTLPSFFFPCGMMEYLTVYLSKDCVIIRGMVCNPVQVGMKEKLTQSRRKKCISQQWQGCPADSAMLCSPRSAGGMVVPTGAGSEEASKQWWQHWDFGFQHVSVDCQCYRLWGAEKPGMCFPHCHHLHLYLLKHHSLFLNKLTLPFPLA